MTNIRLNREVLALIDTDDLPGGAALYEELADVFLDALGGAAPTKVVIFDLDNTLYDFDSYFASRVGAFTETVAASFGGAPADYLAGLATALDEPASNPGGAPSADSAFVGVAVLVRRDGAAGELLVGRRHDGHLALPGGHWMPGETLENAAIRELQEESGLTATAMRIASVHEVRDRSFVTIGFEATGVVGTLAPEGDGRFTALQWMRIDEIEAHPLLYPGDKVFLANVREGRLYSGGLVHLEELTRSAT